MKTLILLFSVALLASAVLVPLTRRIFLKLGKIDYPDARKAHRIPVPRSGGLAVISAYLIAVGLITILPAGGNYVFDKYEAFLIRLLPAVGIVFLTGFLDDWLDLHPGYKLLGQFSASAFAYWAGIRLFDVPPGWELIGFATTSFWLILCSNAFNLTDGTDGLAGSLGVLSCLGLIAVSLSLEYYSLALVFAPLLGAILPFLRANWPPAELFLGDTGSLTLGFLIGCGGAALSRRFPGPEGTIAALLIFTLPFLEVILSSARRWLRGQSIFRADAAHIHHQLKRQGHGDAAVLWRLGALSCAGTAIAVLQIWLNPWLRAAVILPFLLYLGYKIANLRYPEFNVLWEAVLGGRIRAWFRHQILLHTLEDDLAAANTTDQLVCLLDACASKLGLLEINVKLVESQRSHPLPAGFQQATYSVRIDLPLQSWVNFRVPVHLKRSENPAADFAAVLTRTLNLRRLEQCRSAAESPHRHPEVTLV